MPPSEARTSGGGRWWRTNQAGGLILAVLFAGLLVHLLSAGWTYNELRDGFLLGTMPLAAAGAAFVCALAMIVDRHRHAVEEDLEGIDVRSWIACLFLIASSYLYLRAMMNIGFVLTTPPVLVAAMLYLGIRPWTTALGVSLIVTAAVYVIFRALGIAMPSGILPF